jgi:hypothetical protein
MYLIARVVDEDLRDLAEGVIVVAAGVAHASNCDERPIFSGLQDLAVVGAVATNQALPFLSTVMRGSTTATQPLAEPPQ